MSQTVNIKMSRFERTPWGFRLHGGSDFGTPLLIQKVNATSLSEAAGLLAGDILLAVNGQDITQCRHKEAQDVLVRAGNNFELTVQRGGLINQAIPRSQTPVVKSQNTNATTGSSKGQWASVLEGNAAGASDNAADFTKQFMSQLTEPPTQQQQPQQSFNGPAKPQPSKQLPTPTPTKQMNGVQKPKGHPIQSQQYNSPQPLYSEIDKNIAIIGENKFMMEGNPEENIQENLQEVLNQQSEMLTGGVKGINFGSSEVDLSNSETLRMVQELDSRGPEPEPGIDMDPSQAPSHYKGLANKNIQSHSFKMLQRALAGGEIDFDNENDTHDNDGGNSLVNFRNVHAPKISDKDLASDAGMPYRPPSASGARMTPTQQMEGNTLPRATSPAPAAARSGSAHSVQSTASPAFGTSQQNNSFQGMQQSSSQTKGSLQVNGSDAIDTRSNRPKKDLVDQNDDEGNTIKDPASDITNKRKIAESDGSKTESEIEKHNEHELKKVENESKSKTKENKSNIEQNPSSENGDLTVGRQNSSESSSHQCSFDFIKNEQNIDDTDSAPVCTKCSLQIKRGPFITALGKTWCPNHFLCSMESCRRSLQEVGFVEEKGLLYCEDCYGKFLAPDCEKCRRKIIGNCLKAMGKTFHPECFACAYCGKIFANSPFYLEDGLPYCEDDWNELFTTKCINCGFPIEAGDRWVEALNNNYHSQCFNCTLCKKNLEGKRFFVKAGKPFCKSHASRG